MAASRLVPRLVPMVAAMVCVAVSAAAYSAGCNGTGVTPICTFADGALDPEAGCGTPVEASAGDALDDQASLPGGDDDGAATSDAAGNADDASQDAADAAVLDAALHDAAIQDAHSDSKG